MTKTPLTPAAKLQAVREWIVKACPELYTDPKKSGFPSLLSIVPREELIGPIGIAEVLRAFAMNKVDGSRTVDLLLWKFRWNLSDESLDHQKPEVIDWLYTLIP